MSSQSLLAIEDGAAESGALDGHVVVDEEFKVDICIGDVVGEAANVVVLKVKGWEGAIAVY